MTSLSFLGNATSYLRIPNSSNLNFRTGDFTIEWYQYQTDSNSFPRIFQIGSYNVGSGISIGVSIEGGIFLFWSNGTYVSVINLSSYKNQWVHFAICRSSGTTKIFMNGTSIYSVSDNKDYNSTYDLVISNETVQSNSAAFGGYLSYFHWVKGSALYTSNFTVSNTYPSSTANTVLLLNANTFAGTLGSSVVNNNVGTYSIVPTNFSNPNQQTPYVKPYKPAYSNNTLVFYKAGSLSATGVGTVQNSRYKSHRI